MFDPYDIRPLPNNPNPANDGAQPPVPPAPPRLPVGDGYRSGEYQVWESVTRFFEKGVGTLAFMVAFIGALIGRLFRAIGELLLKALSLPATVFMLFPWGKHLLTLGARMTITFWGILILVIGIWDGFVWSRTFAYIFKERREVLFASAIMMFLTFIIERSFAAMASDKPIARQRQLFRRLITGYFLLAFVRVAILVILSIANGEAMRVQLSRDEIDHVIAMQEADTNRQLHDRRRNEIEAEMTRRRTESTTHAENERTALVQRRQAERTQIAHDRAHNSQEQRASVRALDTDATQEMNGAFSGVPSVGRNVRDIRARQQRAADELRAFDERTGEMLREFDHETAEAQAHLSDQTVTRNATLNTEQDRRLEELRHMTLDQLAAQYGEHARRANGFWARRDALETVHERSPSSKHGDWFAMVVLVGIGLLPLLAKKTASPDVASYYSVQAHAFADDGSPFCEQAKQIYASMLLNDEDVRGLQHSYLEARNRLKEQYAAFLAKVASIATTVDVTGLHYPLSVAIAAAERAWFDSDARVSALTESAAESTEKPSRLTRLFRWLFKSEPKVTVHARSMSAALNQVLDLELTAKRSRIPLPAHPGSDEARYATSTVTYEQLEALGWKSPVSELQRREALAQEHEGLQQALSDSLIEFYKRFGRVIRPDDLKDAQNEFYASIKQAELDLTRSHQRFVNMKVKPPVWIYENDPRSDARSIEAIFFRPNTPPLPPTPRRSMDTDSIDLDDDEVDDFGVDSSKPTVAAGAPKLVALDGGAHRSNH